MIDANILFNALSGTVACLVGALGYGYKRFNTRLDNAELGITKTKIAVEKKTSPEDVRAIINDKVAAIHVIVKNIQEDVREIKKDIKKGS